MKLSMTQCKRRLATLWFAGAGVVFAIAFLQTSLNKYADKTNDMWGWLLPTVMPTLSLVIGVIVADALGRGAASREPDGFLYRLTFNLSLVYLLAVLLVFLLQPMTPLEPLQLMKQSNFWLGPFQGLVAAGMGAFFTSVKAQPVASGH
jgi:hypothetical protein